MKKLLLLALCVVMAMSVTGCMNGETNGTSSVSDMNSETSSMPNNSIIENDRDPMDITMRKYPDGTYRGAFINPLEMDVTFVVENNKFVAVDFNTMGKDGVDYLKASDEKSKAMVANYKKVADYLIGKEVTKLEPLYRVEEIINKNDTNNETTEMITEIEGNKLISAINDGLSRGIFILPNENSMIDDEKSDEMLSSSAPIDSEPQNK